MPTQPTRILFESTGTFGTRVNTGIQRVVRNLVREARRTDDDGAPRVLPVIFRNGHFHNAADAWTPIIRRQDRGGLATLPRMNVALERHCPAAARLYGSTLIRLRKLLYPKSLIRTASRVYWQTASRRITFDENDLLLLLDASWGHPIWPAVREARQRGSQVGAVLYDLLPLEFPQFFQQPFPSVFADWLENLVDHSDFFLAISETVRASLETYVRASRSPEFAATKRFRSFRLGAEVPRSSSRFGVRSVLRRLFRNGRDQTPYLAVGTVEPRKNHHYLLDAFELLWRHYPAAPLCIVGRVGWECDDVLNRVVNHPQLQKSLFVFHDLSDNELHFCYERAKALVTASRAEGFGLPIVEALHHNLPVFASDIPVHREVGGPACRYFDLQNARTLAALLGEVEQRGTPLRLTDGRQDVTIPWSESYRDLLNEIQLLQSCVSETRRPEVFVPVDAPPADTPSKAA